jgi:serine phosphatase RsbU (regulator of sigma subunit)
LWESDTPLEPDLTEQRDYLRSIVDTVREPLAVLDADLRVVSVNRAFCAAFRVSAKDAQDTPFFALGGDGQWDIPALRRLLREILPASTHFDDFAVEHDFPGLGPRSLLLNARKLYRPGNHTEMILLAFQDVTEQKRAHDALQAALDRERRITEALQAPLRLELREDAFPGLPLAALYEPAWAEAEVGGDFFDAFALPQGRVALVVADASGKGLSAAARTIQVKDVIRAFSREYPHSPAAIVARLNDFVCDTRRFDDQGEEGFVCLCLAILDPRTGEGSLVTAGCEPPLVLRVGGGPAEELGVPGLPLGVEPRQTYQAPPLRLAPGDTLLMATDGITEARSPRREYLGYEGMVALAEGAVAAAPTLRHLGRAILDGARSFGGGFLRDDACLLLARRAGDP